MKKHTPVHTELITDRGDSRVFTMAIRGNAKTITGIRITSSLTGVAMQVKRHYVGSSNPIDNPTQATVLSLAIQQQMTNKVASFVLTGSVGQAIYYARPSRVEGVPSFSLNGIVINFFNSVTVSITDPQTGAIDNYDVYQSQDVNLTGVLYVY